MITKDQYSEIVIFVQEYISVRKKMFPDNPLSDDFLHGMERTIDLIRSLVKKD